MRHPATVVNLAGNHHRREQSAALAMLPLSLAWAEQTRGDMALAAGGNIDFTALERSGIRVLVLADPWKTTVEEIDGLAASNIPVCPMFSFLPKLLNANQPPVEEPILSESHVFMRSGEMSEALLEQIAVLRKMGAQFHDPTSFIRGPRGYTAQSGSTILSGHLASASSHIDAHSVNFKSRFEVKIPGSPFGRPARIRVVTQLSTHEYPPRFESSARLTWRLVLEHLHSHSPLPYGLQELSDDIGFCRKLLG